MSEGQPTETTPEIKEVKPTYDPQIQEIIDLAEQAALDAQKALDEGNKSAGRRARGILNDIKKKITPLRKMILDGMKPVKAEKNDASEDAGAGDGGDSGAAGADAGTEGTAGPA